MEENQAPPPLTTEQKLTVRVCQEKLAAIETKKLSLQNQYDKLVEEHKNLILDLQKYFDKNIKSTDGYILDSNTLEWFLVPSSGVSDLRITKEAETAPVE